MNESIELLKGAYDCLLGSPSNEEVILLTDCIRQYLDQPEQEPEFNFDLERMKAAIESPISDVTVDDLAKQVKQEPVAWKVIDGTNGEYMFSRVKPMERNYKFDVVIPLYTSPPTREPLSDAQIAELWGDKHSGKTHMVKNFARAIEKAHGIGGGE